MLSRSFTLAVGLLLGAHGLANAQATTPAYLLEQQGCGLLVAGSVGSSFADPKVAGFWQAINKAIADHLHDYLQQDRVKMTRLTLSVSEAPDIGRLVPYALARQRCSRVLQIANDVGEDAQGRYFAFGVTLLRMVPSTGEANAEGFFRTTSESEFTKSYRFARTQEVFDSFYTGKFAYQVYEDLAASGVLDAMR